MRSEDQESLSLTEANQLALVVSASIPSGEVSVVPTGAPYIVCVTHDGERVIDLASIDAWRAWEQAGCPGVLPCDDEGDIPF